jgi:hypothetical protein
MFTVLAFLGCLLCLELMAYVFLVIQRELRFRKEEKDLRRAEIVDSTPPTLLSNLDEYEDLVHGEF